MRENERDRGRQKMRKILKDREKQIRETKRYIYTNTETDYEKEN